MPSTEAALDAWGAYDQNDPFPLFARLRDAGAVHRVTLADGHVAWLILRFDEARSALNDQRFSKDMHAALAADDAAVAEGLPGPELARHMLVVDPPDHTRLRKLVSAAFSPRRVEALRPRVQAIVDGLIDGMADADPGSPVDLVATFAFPLPFEVICELLGVPDADRAPFGTALVTLLSPATSPEGSERVQAASDTVVAMIDALVTGKRRAPGDDLVSALISARDGEDRLTEQELHSTIFQLIVAGHDTTASLIGNGTVALLRHPGLMAVLRRNPDRIRAAIEELLRYDAPVPHSTFRYATEQVDIDGVKIPAGDQVLICLAAANRDPGHFADPDRLDLERAPRHLSFGHGIHFCLGATLARMEGELAFGSLLRRLPELRLAVPDEQLSWEHGDGLVLRGLSSLPVVPGRVLPRT